MVKYDDFMNRAMFMPLINAGKSTVSDQQDVFVINLYKDALDLLVKSSWTRDPVTFGRVCWALTMVKPLEKAKTTMKHPEMYEKMMGAYADFKSKLSEHRKISKRFNEYCKKYAQKIK